MPLRLHESLSPTTIDAPQLMGPVWARRLPPKRAVTATSAPHEPAVLPPPRRAETSPPPIAEHPSLPFTRYIQQPSFHQIDLGYPGLQLVHEEPYLFLVPEFLSGCECDALVRKLASAAAASDGTATEHGRTRTSVSAIMAGSECAGLRARLARLARVSEAQLQPSKLTRYDAGQPVEVPSAWPEDDAPSSCLDRLEGSGRSCTSRSTACATWRRALWPQERVSGGP